MTSLSPDSRRRCFDFIGNFICLPVVSTFTHREKFWDHLETALACLTDPRDSIGTTSSRIQSAGSTHSSSLTHSLKRVSTRNPEMTLFGTWSFFGNPYLLLAQQDLRRSARSSTQAGSQPSLASTLLLFGNSVAPDDVLRTGIRTIEMTAD